MMYVEQCQEVFAGLEKINTQIIAIVITVMIINGSLAECCSIIPKPYTTHDSQGGHQCPHQTSLFTGLRSIADA